jgi:NTP pyrophosphatase (non-canonical NTP hydrolase)
MKVGKRFSEKTQHLGLPTARSIALGCTANGHWDKPIAETTMLNELAKAVHANAVTKGWWDSERNFGESLALIHSEVSEVLEDWRRHRPMNEIVWTKQFDASENKFIRNKPDGIPIELADIIIRVLDLCAFYEIDIDAAIKEKMAFNEARSYRHGNLKA